MKIESLAGVVMYVSDPARTVGFYRELGIPFETHQHGALPPHQETMFGGIHFALWNGRERVVPVFRVTDLQSQMDRVEKAGAKRVHAPIDLGEGKRVTSFHSPDGVEFRLIQLGPDVGPR